MPSRDKSTDNMLIIVEEEDAHYSTSLPIHVQRLMYGSKIPKARVACPRRPEGMLAYNEFEQCLKVLPKAAPWTKDKSDTLLIKREEREERLKVDPSRLRASQSKALPGNVLPEIKSKPRMDKSIRFEKMINQNINRKIAFFPLPLDTRGMPSYVVSRLETACRSARYELPMNKKCLEDMTPLDYLTTYTRLYKEQRDRYMRIYKRFKHRHNDFLDHNNLYPALNSMFGGFLSKRNYDVLCTALFIDETVSFDAHTFVAICTFTDRLYWTTYIEGSNTFNYWAPNRSAIEVIDFLNLKWKLEGLKISKELQCLLCSLA